MRPVLWRLARLPRWWLALALVALAAAWPVLATAAAEEDDPPGRVGRLAHLQGEVRWYDSENGLWETAERNRPLTSGDRLSTAPGARAELRVGSTVLRLAAATELELLELDDERMVFELHSGSLALRLRSRELAREVLLLTREARLAPQRAGHYRLDRIDDSTQAGSWRGELRVLGEGGLRISTGEHVELWREWPAQAPGQTPAQTPDQPPQDEGRLAHTRTPLPQDAFAAWVLRADQDDTRSASTRHVSPEMTGVEDLDRHGRWSTHPEYGALWFPLVVAADWAPYRHGRWLWTARWGWTWVDAAPWGFAPFHYGRWLHHGGRWAWAPGAYVRRPVFSPALVAWVGGPNVAISVQIGGGRPGYAHHHPPHVGWVALAPREPYRPWYRASPGHVERIDRHHPRQRPGEQVVRPRPGEPGRPTIPERVQPAPQQWVNQRAPGGVTVVPRDALFRRDEVQRVVVAGPEGPGRPGFEGQPLPAQAPPLRERPVAQPLPAAMGPQRPAKAEERPAFRVGTEREGRPDRDEGVDRAERIDRFERTERPERPQRVERMERLEREERPGPEPRYPPERAREVERRARPPTPVTVQQTVPEVRAQQRVAVSPVQPARPALAPAPAAPAAVRAPLPQRAPAAAAATPPQPAAPEASPRAPPSRDRGERGEQARD